MLGWIKVDAPDGVKRDFYVRQLGTQRRRPSST
jgi:hypothetical protein